jgi:transposase
MLCFQYKEAAVLKTEMITMTMREVDRLKTILAVSDGVLTALVAAQRLGLTKRQVNRLVTRYRLEGAAGLVSRQRGQPGHRQLAPGVATQALTLIRDHYADFGPTLACEKLRERHGITLAKETVRGIMRDVGLWIPRRQRTAKIYQPRNRRNCVGELIQIDGSDHRWFEGRGPYPAGIHRRRDQSAHAPALYLFGIYIQLLRGDPWLPGALWQATGVLQRQGYRVS